MRLPLMTAQALGRLEAQGSQHVGDLFTTPSEVQNAKEQLNAQVTALDNAFNKAWASAGGASGPLQADHNGWKAFVAQWDQFFLSEPGFLSASSDMDRVHDDSAQLAQWQTVLERDEANNGLAQTQLPTVQNPTTSGGALVNAAKTVSGAEAGALMTLLKPFALAAGLALAVYLGVEFLPIIVEGVKGAHAARRVAA